MGQKGERIAEKFLTKQGYKILDRNFHTRWGELDIVAKDSDVVVFVEVKARSDVDFARPEESVTPTKQEHLKKVAELWLLENYKVELPACRFDVISVVFDEDEEHIIKHFTDAFA